MGGEEVAQLVEGGPDAQAVELLGLRAGDPALRCDEVDALADRVLVLYRGHLHALPGNGKDRVEIGRRMAGLEAAG